MPLVKMKYFLSLHLAHHILLAQRLFFFHLEQFQCLLDQIGGLLPIQLSQKLWVSYVFDFMGKSHIHNSFQDISLFVLNYRYCGQLRLLQGQPTDLSNNF